MPPTAPIPWAHHVAQDFFQDFQGQGHLKVIVPRSMVTGVE